MHDSSFKIDVTRLLGLRLLENIEIRNVSTVQQIGAKVGGNGKPIDNGPPE